MDTLWQDVRFALRSLARRPTFTLVAVLTLALGIGANSAIFSVVDAVLLRPLPYPEADRLVRIFHQDRHGGTTPMSPANFRDVRRDSRTLQEISFFAGDARTLTALGEPAQLEAARVGERFFETLGVRPTLGRGFLPEENEPGRERVVVVSHSFWRARLGGDPGAIGRAILLDGLPHLLVGVAPAGFGFPGRAQVWIPMVYDADFIGPESRRPRYISVIGRLTPGASLEDADRELAALARRLAAEYPETNTDVGITAVSLRDVLVGDVRPALLTLLGAVGLVLLIACVNVANLLLARTTAREGEFAVRAALGAGRGRLVGQMITESLLLALLGGAAGLLLALGGTSLLVSLRPDTIPGLEDVGVDLRVVGFTTVVSLLTGCIFGLAPALRLGRAGLAVSIRAGGRGSLSGPRGNHLRSALVVAEVALSVMLLAGAGLLLRSFVRLQGVDPGFRPEGVLSFVVTLPEGSYGSPERMVEFEQALLERLRALPGVREAGGVSDLPLDGHATVLSVEIAGQPAAAPGEERVAQSLHATPGYFRAVGIPVRRGRTIEPRDRAGAPRVVVINEEAARRYFPVGSAVGERLLLVAGEDTAATEWEVVGVVGDVRQFGLDAERAPAVYFPAAQVPEDRMSYVVSSSLPPAALSRAIRREVAALDPNLPVESVRPLRELVSTSISRSRFYTLLVTIFAGVALSLAAAGIFGVVAYDIEQRTREIGVRIALGAEPRHILRVTLGGAMLLGLGGLGIGLLAALAGMRLLTGLLYGIGVTDPPTYAGAALLLLAVVALASWVPARYATRVDPMVALRAD